MELSRLTGTLILLAGIMVGPSAFADDCDPVFKGFEAYLCKLGRVEHKIGLKKDSWSECVEHKKLTVNSCQVEGVTTDTSSQIIYLVGNKAMKEAMFGFDWQCDVNGGNGGGGLSKTGFDGNWHPDYTIDKFPGESNSDRHGRFQNDLQKQGKYLLGAVGINNPVSKYNKKFDEQVCQFYNAKTNKVAFGFNCKVNYDGEKKEEPKEGGGGKALKKLFSW